MYLNDKNNSENGNRLRGLYETCHHVTVDKFPKKRIRKKYTQQKQSNEKKKNREMQIIVRTSTRDG